MTNHKYIKFAKDYFLFLTNKGLRFDKCYLCGSCALGTKTKYRDIDILLVSNFFLHPSEKQFHYLYDITKHYSNLIDLHFMSLNLFNHINPNHNNNYFSLHFNDPIISFLIPIYISPKPLSLPPHR